MDGSARIVVMVPAVLALVLLGIHAHRLGQANAISHEATREMTTWAATRAQPGAETWGWVRGELERAASLAPRDPQVRELLGILHGQRQGGEFYPDRAAEHFTRALELRPTSAYTWANLASARYLLGQTDRRFEHVLAAAAFLGPSEREVQLAVADLGLALWDEVAPGTRPAIERMVAAGMRRNPMEMLQLSERRDRLLLACRYAAGNPRLTDPRWQTVCNRRGKT